MLVFKCGYRVPHKDRHPDWPLHDPEYKTNEEDKLKTKGDIMIQGVDVFLLPYYPGYSGNSAIITLLLKIGFDTSKVNENNFHRNFEQVNPNIKMADSPVVLDNRLDADSRWGCHMGPGSDRLIETDFEEKNSKSIWGLQFLQKRIYYYQITIGNKTGYYKEEDKDTSFDSYCNIFQCNTPKTDTDTLYFFSGNVLYKAFVSEDEKRNN